ncbi:MAG: hypothetical protein ACRC6T_06985 [Sarcina sp.]
MEKNSTNRKESLINLGKILLVYFIATLCSMIIHKSVIKYDFSSFEFSKNWIVIVGFGISFISAVTIIKPSVKAIKVFFYVMLFLSVLLLLNLEIFKSYASTPAYEILPMLAGVAFITTIPFHSMIYCAIGFEVTNIVIIALPLYIILLKIICTKIVSEKVE